MKCKGISHPRHQILLDPQFPDKEAMNHVQRSQREVDRPAGGNAKGSADDVVA